MLTTEYRTCQFTTDANEGIRIIWPTDVEPLPWIAKHGNRVPAHVYSRAGIKVGLAALGEFGPMGKATPLADALGRECLDDLAYERQPNAEALTA